MLAPALLLCSARASFAELTWRGVDLAAEGIHKGAGLPLFTLYMDGTHSTFATQEMTKDTPPWTVFFGVYNQYYYADRLLDEEGRNVPGRFHLSTYLLVERIILLTPLRTEGGRIQHFFESVPVFVATDFAVGSVSAATAGFGDLGLGTGFLFPEIYQSDALKIEGMFDLDVFLPTGHYHPGGVRNLSFDTYSYLVSQDVTFHLRRFGNGFFLMLSVLSSGFTENDRFVNPLTGERSRYQLGPSIQHIFKLLYHLNRDHTLNFGALGFFDFQYRDDRMDGSRIHDSAERSHMLGPVLSGVAGGFLIDLSLLREFEARNRPEGTRVTIIVYRVF
jgi:hypothetical protein